MVSRPKILGALEMKKVDDESFYNSASSLAKNLRVTTIGGGVSCDIFYSKIKKAKKIIELKSKNLENLTTAEVWLSDNYYLVSKLMLGIKPKFNNLPHIKGLPRVVHLARYVVTNSLNVMTKERINEVYRIFSNYCDLTFDEINNIKNSLDYALLEQVYILAKRILHQNKCQKVANYSNFNRKFSYSDSYLFYYNYNNNLSKDKNINTKDFYQSHNLSLLNMACMAETLFPALRECSDFINEKDLLKLSCAYKEFSDASNFKLLTNGSIKQYLYRVSKISKKYGVDERNLCFYAKKLAQYNNIDVSIVLFDHISHVKKYISNGKLTKIKEKQLKIEQIVYSQVIKKLTFAISVVIGALSKSVFAGIFCYIPTYFVVENIVNFVMSYFGKYRPTLSYNYDTLPSNESVLAVKCEFIGSLKQFTESLEKALVLYESNAFKNVSVALLVDFPKSDTMETAINDDVYRYLSTLKLPNDFYVCIRKKVFIDNKYQAYERKRGALMDFCNFLLSGNSEKFAYINNTNIQTPMYVYTLDADNEVLNGDIQLMAKCFAHPYNNRYDLLNSRSRYNLYSFKTIYSKRFLLDAGCGSYPNYSSFYADYFKRDIFCGKGIFKLKNFFEKLDNKFPSKKILSHDILEGSILKTTSGGVVLEDAPNGFLCDRERRKRWQRGDIQLLPFMFGRWTNDDNKQIKEKIPSLCKFIMRRNIYYNVKDISLLVLAIVGIIVDPFTVFLAIGLYLIPYIIDILRITKGIGGNVRGKYILTDIAKRINLCFSEFFMVGYYAISNLWITISTLGKMTTKKNLLNWKTYYNSQNSDSCEGYVKEYLPSFAILTIVACLLAFYNINAIFLALYLLGSVLVFSYMFLQSRTAIEEEEITLEDEDFLREVAQKTYDYFLRMDNKDNLIPDNYQEKPYKGESNTTSPTNIGFAILSHICAEKLQFCTEEEVKDKLNLLISKIEKLPKWNGNLYNWYDTSTLTNINNFVSSVDSGNFLACLYVLQGYFKEKNETAGLLRVNNLIDGTDISKLYDKAKNQFYLGYNGEYTGHYDLLCSEARILSNIYMAEKNEYEHYNHLQKDYSSIKGNTMLSWSGTMFEYMLPKIFIDTPKFSAIEATNSNVTKIQKRHCIRKMWGVSESGYYEFDENMSYQYHAFGLKKIALSNNKRMNVISAYSSALAMIYAKKESVKNLKNMKKYGAYGKYGFYESIDFGANGRVVKSYMTHHQGMILSSLTNVLCGNYLAKLFSLNRKNKAINNIYNHELSKLSYGKQMLLNERKKEIFVNKYSKIVDKIDQCYTANVIFDGNYMVRGDAIGNVFSRSDSCCINTPIIEYDNCVGGYFYAKFGEEKRWKNPTFLPTCDNVRNYEFHKKHNEIIYKNIHIGIEESIAILPGLFGEVRKFSSIKNLEKIAFVMPLVLNTEDAFVSHPAYNGLFISSQKLDIDTIIFEKRTPHSKEKKYLLVRILGAKNVNWETNLENFIGRNCDYASPKMLFNENEAKNIKNAPSFGDVLSPCVGFTAEFCVDNSMQIVMLYGDSVKELQNRAFALGDNPHKMALQSEGLVKLEEFLQEILPECLYAGLTKEKQYNLFSTNRLVDYQKIVKDKILVSYEYYATNNKECLIFLNSIHQLKMLKINVLPVIVLKDIQSKEAECSLRKLLASKGVNDCIIVSNNEFLQYKDFVSVEVKFNLKIDKRNIPINYIKENLREVKECDEKILEVEYSYKTGMGGFLADGSYCNISCEPSHLPYTHVIADIYGGMLSTNNGGGYFYFSNSREDKCSKFDNDYVLDSPSEYIFLRTKKGNIMINGGTKAGHFSQFFRGIFTHKVYVNDIESETNSYIISRGKARIVEVNIDNKSGFDVNLSYYLKSSLNWRYIPKNCIYDKHTDYIILKNIVNGKYMYMKCITKSVLGADYDMQSMYPYFKVNIKNDKEKLYFIFTQEPAILHSIKYENIEYLKEEQLKFFSQLNKIEISSKDRATNLLINNMVYQIYTARLKGKLGFYQISGATGFRDQLQDCMSFLMNDSCLVKEQILECASHQYVEGDVMHWWHFPKYGLRTRITDDRLFLPYMVGNYLYTTGDFAILDIELPYLVSDKLSQNEDSRFENPPYTDYKEGLLEHCYRAITASLKVGKHGLALLGTGDWNDGIDFAGKLGIGESVFNSMFLVLVIRDFCKYCGDKYADSVPMLMEKANKLVENINEYAFDVDRYKRLYTDNGEWIGCENTKEVKLDLLVQSFAIISGVCDDIRANIVLDTAKKLIDNNAGIIKLLSEPSTHEEYLGYISNYPKGVRENGGQYTHCAMWYLIALTMKNRQDEAYELFSTINPIIKCKNENTEKMYKGEPYVLTGDIYSNEDNYGRAGWSWYTGSLSWCYVLVTKYFYGLNLINNNVLKIHPFLPKKLDNSIVTYKYKDSLYLLEYKKSEKLEIFLDGERVVGNEIILEDGAMKKILVCCK